MTINMPSSPGFSACDFGLQTNTQRFESPLTKNIQRVLIGGGRWMANYSLPKMNRAQMAAWQAFFLSLEGSVNTFYAYDPDARTPRGVATGTPLVKGASQTGSSLNIDGCTAGVTGWMRAGDYFVVNSELKMLTQDATTNGSGETTLNFKPALSNSPADNDPLTVSNCTVPMVLSDDGQTRWRSGTQVGIYEETTFSAIEVF
ncbi:MAG: hypothetical protein K8U57_30485 [Planctomycetes bacterium]|nr:hypothetical protein [Planctomycetota bacterium]